MASKDQEVRGAKSLALRLKIFEPRAREMLSELCTCPQRNDPGETKQNKFQSIQQVKSSASEKQESENPKNQPANSVTA